jgi:hypothetical protein
MRRALILGLLVAAGCDSAKTAGTAADAGEITSFYVDTSADDKALIYNLVGRWYPQDEITRLSDRTLTPEQWCEREPTVLFVYPEKVEVRCAKGTLHAAMIAQAKRDKDGKITLTMRAKEDSPLKQISIQAKGPRATIEGSPCFEAATEHARFPEYEILSREILGGRRCAQVAQVTQE